MTEHISISNLPLERWEELKQMRIQGVKAEHLSFARTAEELESDTEENWRKRCAWRIGLDHKEWLVIELNGKPIGYVMISVGEPMKLRHVGYINGMYISADYRNRGLGGKLLGEALRRLKENNVIKVRLEVIVESVPAVTLYKRFGFEVLGTFRKEINSDGSYYDEFVM